MACLQPLTTTSSHILQESLEAAQRAKASAGDRVVAAGHTNTGQTLRQQAEAAMANADPEVGRALA